MSMTLTSDDLQAIAKIIAPVVQKIVDEKVDELALQTAAGFAEVHEKIDNLARNQDQTNDKLDQVIRIQKAEVKRNDHQDTQIAGLLKLAHSH